MRRNMSGLTVGQIYRVTADDWQDDSPGDTAPGLDFGPSTATLAILTTTLLAPFQRWFLPRVPRS